MDGLTLFNRIDDLIPKNFGLKNDDLGYHGVINPNDLEIDNIKIMMDLYPEYDYFDSNTLIITHHPPRFNPETPNYTIHSNWDIIVGGANEALAEALNLEVIDYFDKKTKIGRICSGNTTINELKELINSNLRISNSKENNDVNSIRIVNPKNSELNNIGLISGFGLSKLEYIKLASKLNLDLLLSGDLTQNGAVLARNLGLTLIDTGHHSCEIPGLIKLSKTIETIGIPVEIIDTGMPWMEFNL